MRSIYKRVFYLLRRQILALLVLSLFVHTCDETPGINSLDIAPPQLTDMTLSPGDLQFDREIDGVKDTLIRFDISVRNKDNRPLDFSPEVIINDTDNNILYNVYELDSYDTSTGRYSGSFSIQTNTNLFKNYEIIVFARNSEQELGNRIIRKLRILGIPGIKPIIQSATITPAIAQIPLAGQPARRIDFVANVFDEDGLENIEQVFMRLISETTGPLGTPFLLTPGSLSGAARSYSTTLEIGSSNSPDKIQVLFYADDKSGLRSDTLYRSLEIIR